MTDNSYIIRGVFDSVGSVSQHLVPRSVSASETTGQYVVVNLAFDWTGSVRLQSRTNNTTTWTDVATYTTGGSFPTVATNGLTYRLIVGVIASGRIAYSLFSKNFSDMVSVDDPQYQRAWAASFFLNGKGTTVTLSGGGTSSQTATANGYDSGTTVTFLKNGVSTGVTGVANVSKVATGALTGLANNDLVTAQGTVTSSAATVASSAAAPLTLPITSNLVSAYSVMRLNGYNGAAAQVQKATDSSVTDIGFNSSQFIDGAAADTFGGGAVVGFSKWYDQVGSFHLLNVPGASYGSATGALASQPVSTPLTEYQGIRPLTFDGDGLTGDKVACWMRTSGGAPALDRITMTVYGVIGVHKTRENAAIWELSDAAFGTSYGRALINTSPPSVDNGTGSLQTANYFRRGVQAFCVSQTASQMIVRVGEREKVINITATPTTSQAIAALSLGKIIFSAAYTGGIDWFFKALYSVSHTSSQMQSMEAALMSAFSIQAKSVFTTAISYAGCSLVSAYGVTKNQSPPTTAGFGSASGVFTNWECFPMAVGGQTLATEYSQRANSTGSLYDGTKTFFVYFMDMPTNDLRNATFTSQADAEAWATDYFGTTTGARAAGGGAAQSAVTMPMISYYKGLGSNVRVIVPTILNAGAGLYSTANFRSYAYAKYNGLVSSQASSLGYTVSDRASIATFNTPTTTNYLSDLLHLNDTGSPIMMATDKAAIQVAAV